MKLKWLPILAILNFIAVIYWAWRFTDTLQWWRLALALPNLVAGIYAFVTFWRLRGSSHARSH